MASDYESHDSDEEDGPKSSGAGHYQDAEADMQGSHMAAAAEATAGHHTMGAATIHSNMDEDQKFKEGAWKMNLPALSNYETEWNTKRTRYGFTNYSERFNNVPMDYKRCAGDRDIKNKWRRESDSFAGTCGFNANYRKDGGGGFGRDG